jgi:hypothetical protein
MVRALLTVSAATLSSSCFGLWTKTPVERARALVPAKCSHVSSELTKLVLAPDSIESVEPDLSYVINGDDHTMRLCGAVIHLRGAPGATPGKVALAVGCHEARVTLGELAPVDDPYVLPGKWADITVWPDGAGFKIRVRGDDFDDGLLLLDRARRHRAQRRVE